MGESAAEVGDITPDATLPIAKIKPNPNQPRKNFDDEALSELADSIEKNGVLQPILVRKKGSTYEIVAGERRYQASKIAKLKEIPVVIREISDDEVFKLALIENLQRSDLNPIEEAQGYRQLIDRDNLTQEALAQILSKSRSAVANTLRLLDLPEDVQNMMADGSITAGHARAILAVSSEEGRSKLAQKVVQENLTVRQTENLAPLFSGMDAPKKPRPVAPQSYKRAARQLRTSLDTPVKVRQTRGHNKIEIEFTDEDDLERICQSILGLAMGEE
ncbi:MAG: ParB/RepB/Spo0J family partition protein [Atopobiaceae bacterium]|jgi:ParB family chromosome partitioning protein|nr:ParB/RepB/Spo0J family partition protein [Atopobiaceae bacterium]MCH4180826.1 ParB/RepB/Spo0J family partition protein [Atopobiaceae bacterium]MCH4214131.1 ParB/RepB/Spo0J family partition protein [Atopobiaceae bacterium]MCH4229695.1 ParB/RepB/Spo0J family partition protein [Atopobiaceae bacterium]MCH4276483.1 ParB/RepB/Spo0J family partition protein [Atopobiaceae bacterium]